MWEVARCNFVLPRILINTCAMCMCTSCGWHFTCKSAVEEFEVWRIQELEAKQDLRNLVHQQLRVPDLPPDVSFTDWASCPQQVPLVMMRPVVSTAQSMTVINYSDTSWQRSCDGSLSVTGWCLIAAAQSLWRTQVKFLLTLWWSLPSGRHMSSGRPALMIGL